MEKYIIVEDKNGNLSIVSNQEYRKENDNRLKWEAIDGSDEMEEAEKNFGTYQRSWRCAELFH